MAVTVRSTAGYDIVGGSQSSNVTGYSISTEISTQNPADYAGGAPRASVNVNRAADVFLALDEEVVVQDDVWRLTGDITAVSESNFLGESLTIDSRIARLNRDGSVPPQRGVTLLAAVQAFFSAGRVSLTVVGGPAGTVNVPGHKGNLLDGLKQMLSAYGCYLEENVSTGVLTLREFNVATVVALPSNVVSVSRSVSNQSPVERVEVEYSQWTPVVSAQVYPYSLENPMVITVAGEEVVRFEFQLNASLSSVNQPTAVDTINLSTIETVGQYAVVSSAGVPVPASQWRGQGGSLEVRLLRHDTIEVTVRGMKDPGGETMSGPYRIAEYDRGDYPALYITGTGVRSEKDTLVLRTGSTKAPEDSAQTVSNPFLSTLTQAFDRGQWAVAETTVAQTFEFESDAVYSVGQKVLADNVVYRITSCTVGPGRISKYSCIMETSMKDFNNRFGSGVTIANFNSMFGSRKMRQTGPEPLRGS